MMAIKNKEEANDEDVSEGAKMAIYDWSLSAFVKIEK